MSGAWDAMLAAELAELAELAEQRDPDCLDC